MELHIVRLKPLTNLPTWNCQAYGTGEGARDLIGTRLGRVNRLNWNVAGLLTPCFALYSISQAEFLAGKRYYSSDSFGLAIDHFEAAVEEYFSADQECRALCEGAYVYDGYNYMEYSADLFQSMTGEIEC